MSFDSVFTLVRDNTLLIGSAGFAVWLLFFRRRAGALVKAGRVTSAEVSVAFWGGLSVVSGSGLLLWLLQYFAGPGAAHCLMLSRPRTPAQWTAWLVLLSTYGLPLWWVFARGGDNILSRLEPAVSLSADRPSAYSPATVRIGAVAFYSLVLTGLVISNTTQHARCDQPSNQRLERP